jgi:hypothetical protein
MWFRDDGVTLTSPPRAKANQHRAVEYDEYGATFGSRPSAASMRDPYNQPASARSTLSGTPPAGSGLGLARERGKHSPPQGGPPPQHMSNITAYQEYIDADAEAEVSPRHSGHAPKPSLREARQRRKVERSGSDPMARGGSREPLDPLSVYEQYTKHVSHQTALDELLHVAPTLSHDFHCSEEDALVLVALVTAASNHRGTSADVGRLEDKVITLESEGKLLRQRLERRDEEVDRLKDDLENARGKVAAIENQAKQTIALVSQKRDEVRRQLINEESRTMKLQKQCKTLEAEVDRLKARLHALMQK